MRKGVRKPQKTAHLPICCRIGSSFTSALCWMHFELRYMLTKVRGSYLKEGFQRNRYILTICIWLSSERDIIVPLMDERAQTRNLSLCLRRQFECRHWLLCNFYFLQPWLIACLSAWIFFFFSSHCEELLCTLCASLQDSAFFKCTMRNLSFMCVCSFLFAGVVVINI